LETALTTCDSIRVSVISAAPWAILRTRSTSRVSSGSGASTTSAVVATLYRKLRTTNRLLGEKNSELSFQSSRDPLTALYNRRHFGVLAFLVSARTREFGVRLAVGATRRHLLVHVLSQGGLIAVIGIAAGAAASYLLASISASWFEAVRLPGAFPTIGAAAMLIGAAIVASLMPAARASRVDVLQALRSE
jgi:hypothetical protein